jgi:hypothetical protein
MRSEKKNTPTHRKVKGFLQSALLSLNGDCNCNELGKKISEEKGGHRSYSPPAFRQKIAVIPVAGSKQHLPTNEGHNIVTGCIRSAE